MIWTCVFMFESGDIMKTGLTIFWNDLLHTKVNTSNCRMENARFLTGETRYQKFCQLMNWNPKSCAKIINQKWFQLIRSLTHWRSGRTTFFSNYWIDETVLLWCFYEISDEWPTVKVCFFFTFRNSNCVLLGCYYSGCSCSFGSQFSHLLNFLPFAN